MKRLLFLKASIDNEAQSLSATLQFEDDKIFGHHSQERMETERLLSAPGSARMHKVNRDIIDSMD